LIRSVFLGFFLVLVASAHAVIDEKPAEKLPNIVIFILDDVGQKDIGAYGNPFVHTPNIDKLAAEGMRFDNAFLTTSSCSPSRASILTGKYPSATRAPNLHDPLPSDQVSLPQLLQQAGYYTASVGKWHLGDAFQSHFDRVVDAREESGSADWLPELARRPEGKPYFFWFASKDAHAPYYWSTPLRRHDPSKLVVPSNTEDNASTRQFIADYYDEIARADENVGKVIASLRQQGELDNTLVIVLSDNGSQISGFKTTLYDDGLKTPLIMRFPSLIKSGSSNHQLVSSVDLLPTVLTLAGLQTGQSEDGVSLLASLANPDVPVRNYIYAERNRHGSMAFERALRTSDFLYKRNYYQRKLCDPYADSLFDPDRPIDIVHEEFYHLKSDPKTRKNLVAEREFGAELNSARTKLSHIMSQSSQHPPSLILEQCPRRGWADRIRWPLISQD